MNVLANRNMQILLNSKRNYDTFMKTFCLVALKITIPMNIMNMRVRKELHSQEIKSLMNIKLCTIKS